MSTCPRCGKWNGAVAAPAGTEPTWCVCGYARERRETDALKERVASLEATIKRDMGGDYLSLQALYVRQLSDIKTLELRVKDLERSERELAEQRDHAEEWADKLAEAIALHFREDIGEHSNLNNPWAHAHNLIAGNFCR